MSTDKATIKAVQRALIERGFDVGRAGADGIMGGNTKAAIAAFQRAAGLAVQWPGTLGPKTVTALLGSTPAAVTADVLPWMIEAKRFLGMHEVRDAKTLDKALRLDSSEIAWCGAFVGMCISNALPFEPQPANPLGSRNWLKFGKSVDDVHYGAIAVFWRGSKNGWQGHTGFVAGHDKTYVHVLGGNQSNAVTIAKVAKSRLLGYRFPTTGDFKPGPVLPFTTINATVTTNEA